jgi:potassium channel subfamily K
MNDPGLDEPISNDARDVENQVNDEHDEKEEDEQAFLEPRQVLFLTGDCLRNPQPSERSH